MNRILLNAFFILALAGCGARARESARSDSAVADCPQINEADATAITQERADMLIGFT